MSSGGEAWEDCGAPDQCNAVTTLASYRGRLYAGTGRYKMDGSALPSSPNEHPGGKVYRYDGDGNWTDCGRLNDSAAVAPTPRIRKAPSKVFFTRATSASTPRNGAAMAITAVFARLRMSRANHGISR